MRLFCDHCGTEFSPKALRAESRFCSSCGKPLSEFVKEQAYGTAFRSRGLLPTPDDQYNDPFSKKEGKKRKDRELRGVNNSGLGNNRHSPKRTRKEQRNSIPQSIADSNLSEGTRETSTEGQNETEETEVSVCAFDCTHCAEPWKR